MSAGTIQESFSSGDQTSQSIFVGPNSKLIAGVSAVGTNTSLIVVARIRVAGTTINISGNLASEGLIDFFDGLYGNIPAGTEVELRITGTYSDVQVFLMTS